MSPTAPSTGESGVPLPGVLQREGPLLCCLSASRPYLSGAGWVMTAVYGSLGVISQICTCRSLSFAPHPHPWHRMQRHPPCPAELPPPQNSTTMPRPLLPLPLLHIRHLVSSRIKQVELANEALAIDSLLVTDELFRCLHYSDRQTSLALCAPSVPPLLARSVPPLPALCRPCPLSPHAPALCPSYVLSIVSPSIDIRMWRHVSAMLNLWTV